MSIKKIIVRPASVPLDPAEVAVRTRTTPFARLRQALTYDQDALDQLSGLRDKPAGRVRLLHAGIIPDVVLEVTADDSRIDIVRRRLLSRQPVPVRVRQGQEIRVRCRERASHRR